MIYTILRKLMTNPVKFTPKNGIIIIFSSVENNYMKISVKDTGIGIPPDKIIQIFKIDTNVTTPGTDNEQGTGPGLVLEREFADKNNGKIEVESTPCVGSVISLSLPKAA